MKRHWLLLLIAANLVGAAALAFIYPHLMVAPGALVPGHAALTTDCFACHVPLHGVTAERCMTCHALPDIGLKTTRGKPIVAASRKIAFHQQLTTQDCMACHSDHAGPKLVEQDPRHFSHALLRESVAGQCASCHAPPDTALHKDLRVGCAQCHATTGWKPATFDHARLPKTALDDCASCHQPPGDPFHANIREQCGQCHVPKGWKPATFDHAKSFVLDGDHDAACKTCHAKPSFREYTCYGCHEHTPDNIRRKHEEEGVRDFQNCVACHRSAEGEREGGRGRD